MTNRQLNNQLFILMLALFCAFAWVCISLLSVLNGAECPEWFQRSGAILVVVAILSNIATTPAVADASGADFLDSYASKRDAKQSKEDHWAKKYKVLRVLGWLELILAIAGTFIWSYGDLWFSKLIIERCA